MGFLNINVGVMGHVDSGKTSLVKALSTSLSTASLDKHPQSRERGITLDLGFSSFTMPIPERLRGQAGDAEGLQLTLVDCPGHASLIRTIIGGSHVIDLVILVIDATHGIQAQTVECVILAEITTNAMIIVLNKVDMLPEEQRQEQVEQVSRGIRQSLKGSKFIDVPIIPMAAAVGGEKVAAIAPGRHASGATQSATSPGVLGLDELLRALGEALELPRRSEGGPLYMAVDHCFPIKGQGTVLTGTVLSGAVGVNDVVELPELGEQRKVKSMQMFHRPVKAAAQGDRVALCVTSLDAKAIERGIVATPGSMRPVERAVALVRKVRAFRGAVKTGSKLHISAGHMTVMARVTFFGAAELRARAAVGLLGVAQDGQGASTLRTVLGGESVAGLPSLPVLWDLDYRYQEEMVGREDGEGGAEGGWASRRFALQYALLEFETPIMCPEGGLLIGSRLDTESGAGRPCRIAMFGRLLEALSEARVGRLRLYKEKMREGSIYRLGEKVGCQEVYSEVTGQGLFKKETDLTAFMGMRVEAGGGQEGVIESGFGKTGRFKVRFAQGLHGARVGDRLLLRFRKYVFDPARRMVQPDRGALPPPPPPSAIVQGETDEEEMVAGSALASSPPPPRPPPPPPSAPEEPLLRSVAADAVEEAKGGEAVEVRSGQVDAVKPGDVLIVKGLFSMEEDIRLFVGCKVRIEGGEGVEGCVTGPFGKGGKCKVQLSSAFKGEPGAAVSMTLPKETSKKT